jgi:hypothetical protein
MGQCIHVLGATEISEAVRPQVDECSPLGQAIDGEVMDGTRENCLPSMGNRYSRAQRLREIPK